MFVELCFALKFPKPHTAIAELRYVITQSRFGATYHNVHRSTCSTVHRSTMTWHGMIALDVRFLASASLWLGLNSRQIQVVITSAWFPLLVCYRQLMTSNKVTRILGA
jgi:hypothetical protein